MKITSVISAVLINFKRSLELALKGDNEVKISFFATQRTFKGIKAKRYVFMEWILDLN